MKPSTVQTILTDLSTAALFGFALFTIVTLLVMGLVPLALFVAVLGGLALGNARADGQIVARRYRELGQ